MNMNFHYSLEDGKNKKYLHLNNLKTTLICLLYTNINTL